MSATPRDAASVIILRNSKFGAQALLTRRHADLAFAGGTWVFPGGKLEAADASTETLNKLGLAESESAPYDTDAQARRRQACGLLVAACRETFEETGIVLARHRGGAYCGARLAEELQPFRSLSRDAGSFAELLAGHGLIVDPSSLLMWSHWITPSVAPRRFDARFFIALMPPGQIVRCDSSEATQFQWLNLCANEPLPDESLVPAPATRFSLGDLMARLREHDSLEQVMTAEAHRRVAPVMPKMLRIEGRMAAIMPWDPEYQSAPGDGIDAQTPIPPQYLGFPSRVFPSQQISGMPGEVPSAGAT